MLDYWAWYLKIGLVVVGKVINPRTPKGHTSSIHIDIGV